MYANLEGNGTHFANVHSMTIVGTKTLGGYRLTFIFTIKIPEARSDASMVLENVWCRWSVGAGSKHVLIGNLVPDAAIVHQRHKFSQDRQQLILCADLSTADFHRLEESRGGGDLALKFEFQGHIRISGTLYALGSQPAEEVIPHSQWIGILRTTGIVDYWLLEVAMPGNYSDAEMSAAAECLRDAHQAHRLGQYDQAVGHCRGVWERIRNKFGDKTSTNDTRKQTKEDKWTVVRESLHQVTHLAHHHYGVAGATTFTRADSIAAIGAAAAIIHLYA